MDAIMGETMTTEWVTVPRVLSADMRAAMFEALISSEPSDVQELFDAAVSSAHVPLSEPVGWQPIETAPKGKKVIVFGQVPNMMHPHTMVARYWPRGTLEVADDFQCEDWAEEIGDGVYMPEGWYEETMGEEAPVVNIRPTHWMKLPEPPK